jgi:hypothetical protein
MQCFDELEGGGGRILEGSRGVLAQLDGDPHFGGLDILSFKTCARLTYSATSKGSDTLFARRPFSPFVLSSVV